MTRIFLAALITVAPIIAHAGDWQTFSRFWGYVLTIEDQCPSYAAMTDAVMGGHLNSSEYDLAQAEVIDNRDEMQGRVGEIGCDAAAREAADMMDMTMTEAWGID